MMSDSLWKIVDWDGLECVYKESKEFTCQWAMKYMSGFFWTWEEHEVVAVPISV